MNEETPSEVAGDSEEVASARRVFRELDKAGRATRTYGLNNAATARFFEQLQRELDAHLSRWPVLAVVVERGDLRMGEATVVGGDENLAIRLHADGVRELRLEQGVAQPDLQGFVDALWGQTDPADDADEDVVTRLWSRDLQGISVVTAEDIVKLPTSLLPQESGFFAPPPPSFEQVLDNERALAGSPGREASSAPQLMGSGVAGFRVEPAERAQLEAELDLERATASVPFVLRVLQAIIVSETSPELITRALATIPATLDALLAAGDFVEAGGLLSTLALHAPGFDATQRLLAERVSSSLNMPGRVALIATGLFHAAAPAPGLAELLARLQPSAAEALCGVLAEAVDEDHRAALREALGKLCAEHPEPVLAALLDPRPQYALDLIAIIAAWDLPRTTQALGSLARHPDVSVRTEAVTTLSQLLFAGDGRALFAFAFDGEQAVRQRALRGLSSGKYQLTWDTWRPHLDLETLLALPLTAKRAVLQAVQATSGDASVFFLQGLVSGRGWTMRKEREETALLAVQALSTLGSERATAALRAAMEAASSSVRKACAAALEAKAANP
jgi:HEAT repeat protein